MLVLLMASTLRDQVPSIVFEQPNELAELHVAHRAERLDWPYLNESGEGERRTRDERLAVRAIPGTAHLREEVRLAPLAMMTSRRSRGQALQRMG